MSTQTSIPHAVVREHVTRLTAEMTQRDLQAVTVFHRSNMMAYAGTDHAASDRLVCATVLRDGRVVLLCPHFEYPTVADSAGLATIVTWAEDEDPYARLAKALRDAGVGKGRLGIDGRMWKQTAEALQAVLPELELVNAEAALRTVRICKTPAEQELLRAAHRKGAPVFLTLRDEFLRPGIAEVELVAELERHFADSGIVARPLLQSGPRGSIPHNHTGTRKLQAGDAIVVDSVIRWNGYFNDLTRTFAIGDPGEKTRRAYAVVRAAQAAAFAAAKPGVPCRELDRVARQVITDAGFGEYFAHRLGHGMGLECHEPPYLVGNETEILQPGMCMTVEPGIYIPGEFGIRIEDDILITADGCEVISRDLPTDVSEAFAAA